MSFRSSVCLWVAVAAFKSAPSLLADPFPFGYSYTAEPSPKGTTEIYQWITSRHGRDGKPDTALNFATEFEYAFTDRLTGSLYVDTGAFSDQGFVFQGLRSAWNYNMLSPFKDPIGLGLYLEPIWARTSSTDGEREDKWAFESKLLLQKNFFEDRLILVSNIVGEWETEREPGGEWEDVFEFAVTAGASIRLGGGFSAGLEALYVSKFEGFGIGSQEKQQIAVGPNVHYLKGRTWATLAWLVQVWGDPSTDGSRNLAGFDEHQIRLVVGYTF